MTKGEAYKRYYEANKERILERNRERNRVARERLRDEGTETEKEKERERQRLSYHRRKAVDIGSTLIKEADRLNNFWSPFFRAMATSTGLSELSDKHLHFILSLPGQTTLPESLTPS